MEENRGEMGRKQAIIGLKYNPQSWDGRDRRGS